METGNRHARYTGVKKEEIKILKTDAQPKTLHIQTLNIWTGDSDNCDTNCNIHLSFLRQRLALHLEVEVRAGNDVGEGI